MIARYKIYRGKRPASEPLPDGVRKDTRKHTKHCLRPTEEGVRQYLTNPTSKAWKEFAAKYLQSLDQRFEEDPTPFDELAGLAQDQDVRIGCSCPTAKNPDVNQCHTVLALQFMKEHYPALEVEFPR
jgi:uncharacterized protein YeaO (DUF488 family)